MEEFVDRMATEGRGMSAAALESNPSKWVIMLRDSLRRDYEKNGVTPTSEDAWSWSMWKGYLKDAGEGLMTWLKDAQPRHLHTSGHASTDHLLQFAQATSAKRLIPIHSFTWDENMESFPSICRLQDGETLHF